MSGSPAISSAKRVHRAHWMHRSRSRSVRGPRAMGLAQWRFSSTKRLSPGPHETAWSCKGHSPPLSHTGQSSGWLRRRNSSTPSWAFTAAGAFGRDLLALDDRHEASGLQGRTTRPGHLDEAHPAHADRRHPRVVAKARDVHAGALGGLDDELTVLRLHRAAVKGDLNHGAPRAAAAGSRPLSRAGGTRRESG